ncbi:MAG TPA: hypothetical protein VFZ01_07025 [Geminicoccaceae bacterium]
MRAEGRSRTGPRRFLAGFAIGALLLLGLVEVALRSGLVDPGDPRLRVIRDSLMASNRSAAFGDSHIARRPNLGGRMVFAGFGGATLFEVDRIIEQYYRTLRPDRVILEVGPQMFAPYRQRRWAGMSPRMFQLQVLPWPLLVLEPGLVGAFMRWLTPPSGLGRSEPVRMSRTQRTFENLLSAHGEGAFAAAPRDLRRTLTRARVEQQEPAAAIRRSVAWRNLEKVLDRLERLEATVCLVVTPVAQVYEGYAGERHDAAVEQVRAEAGRRGIAFRHYTELGLPLRAGHFLNQDHLNRRGRQLYWPAVYEACFDRPRVARS